MALCAAIDHNLNALCILPSLHSLLDLSRRFVDDDELRKVIALKSQFVKLFH